jgi:type IV secretory pathway VirB10-like protein
MSPDKPPELEPSLGALLGAEREGLGIPADAQAALWARLEATVNLPPVGHPASPAARVALANGKGLVVVLAGLGVAAVLAALAVAARPSDPVPTPSIERRPPPASIAPSEPPPPPPTPSETASEPPAIDPGMLPDAPARPHPPAARATAPSDDDLAKERALIEAARAAIRGGAASRGIDKLDEHARAFPRGRLSEERDALHVLALRASGRSDEAASATAAFRDRYPHSLLLGNP